MPETKFKKKKILKRKKNLKKKKIVNDSIVEDNNTWLYCIKNNVK